MRKIQLKQITAWSFSRYSDYKQCPLKAKLKHIDRIKEPPNQAMARGAAIHDMAEGYIKGTVKRLPKELSNFSEEFRKFKKIYKKSINGMVVEDTWAFTKDWDQTTWNDWVGCWLRVKLDFAIEEKEGHLIIKDWKTGKFRRGMNEDYMEQLELYALSAFLLMDHIETVEPQLVYLDQGTIYPDGVVDDKLIYTRDDIPRLMKAWEKRVKPMLKDKKFAPRPNDKCCWCFYRKNNAANGGGQCKF